MSAVGAIPGVKCRPPEGAFYAFADVRGLFGLQGPQGALDDDLSVAKFLLEEAGVASVPGAPFGAPGYIRFSYATSEENIVKGLKAAGDAVRRLKR
ncbi:MAG: hypothetical protein NVS3B10_31190 [Polyangiales bacterium]